MIDRKKLIEVTVEEVNKAKHTREGTAAKIGIILGETDIKKAQINTLRHVEKVLGLKLSTMLTEHTKNGKVYKVEDFLIEEDTLTIKEYFDKLIQEGVGPAELINNALKQYQIGSRKKCIDIFKSFYKVSPAEYIDNLFKPSKEEAILAIIKSNTLEEFKSNIGNPSKADWARWRLFDSYFKGSTFIGVKAGLVLRGNVEQYIPRREDNIAIISSQRLGDGSIVKDRFGSIRIVHGIKQLDYLIYKVSLLNKAYPKSPPITNIKVNKHTQGHEYCSWYWGVSKDVEKVKQMSLEDVVSSMTPLGWLLYFLDDGHLNIGQTTSLSFSTVNDDLKDLLINELRNYGFNFYKCGNEIKIAEKIQVAKYINTMLLPFKDQVPACMQYKLDMKI